MLSCVSLSVLLLATELAIGNIVRRVLHMIREEQQQEQLSRSEGGSAAQDAADRQQVRLCVCLGAKVSVCVMCLDCVS